MNATIAAVFVGLTMGQSALPWEPGIGDIGWPALLSASTNVDGVVLKVEFADTSVVAGERLKGKMVVSNASQIIRRSDFSRGVENSSLDTAIGQFVVENPDGYVLPRTFWLPPTFFGGASGGTIQLDPGEAIAFPGDLVTKYSLTNPGVYRVKAVAKVPKPITDESMQEMIIETPFVSITVLPRPEGMPPPEPLHTASQLANTPKNIDPPQLQVTHPKRDPMPSVPRVGSHRSPLPVPQSVQDRNGATATAGGMSANKETTASASRNVVFAVIALLLGGGLALYLWWSRRKHGHS